MSKKPKNNDTLLFDAVKRGDLKDVKSLIEDGADVNFVTGQGGTLYEASYRGHLEIVKLLVENGASVSEKVWFGLVPVYSATIQGHHEVLEYLIKNGGNPFFIEPNYGSSLFDEACVYGFPKCCEVLIKFGVKPSFKNWTLLREKKEEFYKVFFKNGFVFEYDMDKDMEKVFMENFKVRKLDLLLIARYKDEESPFFKDNLPFDLFKEIYNSTKIACRKYELEIFSNK